MQLGTSGCPWVQSLCSQLKPVLSLLEELLLRDALVLVTELALVFVLALALVFVLVLALLDALALLVELPLPEPGVVLPASATPFGVPHPVGPS